MGGVFDYRLHVFRRVAEEQSLSRAARALHISQPAVTRHVKELEAFVGTSLFVRTSGGVTLTEAGLVLLDHARHVGAAHEETLRTLRAKGGTVAGKLRLGASTTVTQYYLPRVLIALKKRYPAVEVEVVEANSDVVIGDLLARRIEMGLIERTCRRRDLRVTEFYEDEIIVVAPPGHPLAGNGAKAAVTLDEVLREPIISREVGSGTRLTVETELRRRKVKVDALNIVQELPSTEAIKRMVAGGCGLGFVSKIGASGEIAAGTLVHLKVRGVRFLRPFSAILPLGPDPVGLRQLVLGLLST